MIIAEERVNFDKILGMKDETLNSNGILKILQVLDSKDN
jgi:hypothetical protein